MLPLIRYVVVYDSSIASLLLCFYLALYWVPFIVIKLPSLARAACLPRGLYVLLA